MADKKRRPMYVAIMGGSKNGCSAEHAGCPVHKALRDMALEAITEPKGPGYFKKDDLLAECEINGQVADMSYMADAIHWDYIVRNLIEEDGAELIPLAPHFFSKVSSDQESPLKDELTNAARDGKMEEALKLASRSIASGHGKKTAGYAQFSQQHGLLVLARLKRTKAVADGVTATADRQEKVAEKKHVGSLEDQRSRLLPAE
jgi:hypothetical protein